MKIINEGSFTGVVISGLLFVGGLVMYFSLEWVHNYYLRIIGFSIGLALVSAGGYAGRAKALGLKPFGSGYKRIRDSYKKH